MQVLIYISFNIKSKILLIDNKDYKNDGYKKTIFNNELNCRFLDKSVKKSTYKI